MFEKSSVLSFFPTFVWVYDLTAESAQALNAALGPLIMAELAPDGRAREVRGNEGHSLQSATDLHERPEFAPLVAHAEQAGQQILKFLEHAPAPLRITGCWANVSAPYAHHREHSHPNNFLSGVYYVAAPRGGDSINFHDPRPQAHVVAPQVASESLKHASSVNVDVKPGRLVFFPAWLRHSVDPNQGEGPRISIAFNLMFEDFRAAQSKPRFAGQFLKGETG